MLVIKALLIESCLGIVLIQSPTTEGMKVVVLNDPKVIIFYGCIFGLNPF